MEQPAKNVSAAVRIFTDQISHRKSTDGNSVMRTPNSTTTGIHLLNQRVRECLRKVTTEF